MTRFISEIRKGSSIAHYAPNGIVEGVVEANPDYPPRIHYFDERGTVDLVPVKVPVTAPLDPFNVHEHPPLIAGQEYPRFVRPISPPDCKVDVKWKLP